LTARSASLALAVLLAAAPAPAQESGGDSGFLTGFIERNLSGAGREVRLSGFEGALSSRATFAEMTIADGTGVWLTIRDGAISWNRGALLRGRLEIGELSAGEIEVARPPRPAAAPGLPDPTATPFRLPELPVSVEIGSVQAESVHLGVPVLGREVTLALQGTLSLAGGEGAARAEVVRTDGTEGSLTLDAAFVNATEALTLDLALSEPEGGIAATLLNLPGRPALELSVEGSGPLSEFTATLALASDGAPRLTGTARLAAEPAPDPAAAPERSFALDLAGDLAPLFLPEYRAFFGPDVQLSARGRRTPGGETRIETLSASAAALMLEGSLTLAPDGLPAAFALAAEVAAPDGGPVRLPVAGPPVEVRRASLTLAFDAARGESWQGTASLRELSVGDDRLAEARLAAAGQIGRSPEAGRRIAARLSLAARGLSLADPALAEAAGDRLDASATALWREGQPLALSNATVESATARLVATGTLGALAEGLPLTLKGTLNLETLAAFSALAGRPLGGRLILALNGTTALLDGRFDLRAGGAGRDLSAGIEPLDRILAGASRVALDARRDERGILLRRFDVTTPEARIATAGRVFPGATRLEATARLEAAGRVFPGLEGAAELRARIAETAPGRYDLSLSGEGPGEAVLGFAGELVEDAAGALAADGRLTARVARLAALAPLAGRPLHGSLALTLQGSAAPAADRFELALDLSGEGLAVGQPGLDRLLGGTATLSAEAARAGDSTTIRRLSLATRELSADATGSLGHVAGRLTGRARLRDVALFAPDFPGALELSGELGRSEHGSFSVNLRARGPGGTTADVTGSLTADLGGANLRMRGEAPLGLANTAIAPQALRGRAGFDLALRGPAALSALSGRIETRGARLIAPGYGVAVSGLGGSATLAGGTVALDFAGGVEGGGAVAAAGTLGLAAPNRADLRLTLDRARVVDPRFFETDVSGAIDITGALSGGGRIAGALDLGPTEIRVAATGLGTGDELPGLRHVNEPAAVRLTRLRAGFDGAAGGGGSRTGGTRPLALDLMIRAPNRIFVRGRGLDAELGGALRLAGTTAAVVPEGQFELLRGRLDILGRRLALDEGLARLEGSFDPYVRLVAVTEADGLSVRIVVEGPVSAPDIRFESAPPLPEDEVLARLFFGRGLSALSPLQAAQLASAVAELSGAGGEGLVSRLRRNFGLDDLDVTTDAEGNAAVRAGRYLSENVYTEVTVGAEGKSDISINLDLSRSVTVKGSVDSEGETGIGVFFETDY
jgi:translocation and assembly module TamB